MAIGSDLYFSIKITRFLMQLVGIWAAENKREEMVLNFLLSYSAVAMIISIIVTAVDFYFSFDDFYAATYTACALMPVILCFVKIIGFLKRRSMVLGIIRYTRDNFWNIEYDEYGKAVFRKTNQKGVFLICSFSFFVVSTCVCYISTPILENVGKNATERIFAFNLYINLPLQFSPYYQMTATIQALSCLHAGVCFCCFDSLLCMLNMHAAAQFKILQRKIESLCEEDRSITMALDKKYAPSYIEKYTTACYEKFKQCVRQHLALIKYVADLETVFTFLVLGQLLVSSVMLCVAGFQAAQEQATIVRRLIFVAHTLGSMCQLFVVTMTSNEIIVESGQIGFAAYATLWSNLPYEGHGKKLRDGLVMVILRAKKPCCLTAGGFFPVSLETFTKVATSSMSYFTMLRQMEEDISEN